MKLIDTKCPHCGSSLKVDSTIKNATCEYCGATFLIDDEVQHIKYDNAEEAGYNFEKGRLRAQAEAVSNVRTSQSTSQVQKPSKKRKTWLWILGWICIFPLPLTILLLRKKNMKPALKYGLIALAWIVYILFSISRSENKEKNAQTDNSTAYSSRPSAVISTEVAATDVFATDFAASQSAETENVSPEGDYYDESLNDRDRSDKADREEPHYVNVIGYLAVSAL